MINYKEKKKCSSQYHPNFKFKESTTFQKWLIFCNNSQIHQSCQFLTVAVHINMSRYNKWIYQSLATSTYPYVFDVIPNTYYYLACYYYCNIPNSVANFSTFQIVFWMTVQQKIKSVFEKLPLCVYKSVTSFSPFFYSWKKKNCIVTQPAGSY